MKRKICFMFINGTISEPQIIVMDLGQGEMIIAGVGSYEMACREAKKLVEEGVLMIELCGGFGTIGHAKVTEAVDGKIQVGVVRFDNHPGYDNISGDAKWLPNQDEVKK
ncbi:MAG: hypothetical protein JJE49_06300 [Peptostreptococcaceae bacterium]|nr:hypothetical protein [Peptostreptococcaceae bacterium]